MHFYKKTGCRILLVGYLEAVPDLKMDQQGEFNATLILIRKKIIQDKLGRLTGDEVLSYQVFISGQIALRIRQFGFPGLYLWVEGDLQSANEIFAEKIGFLDFPEPNETNKISSIESINELCHEEKFNLHFLSDEHDEMNKLQIMH